MGAVRQVKKDFTGAVQAYGYASFLDLKNPKPQLHAAECFLAMGDKDNALSCLAALEEYCPKNSDLGREYRAKAAELKALDGGNAENDGREAVLNAVEDRLSVAGGKSRHNTFDDAPDAVALTPRRLNRLSRGGVKACGVRFARHLASADGDDAGTDGNAL